MARKGAGKFWLKVVGVAVAAVVGYDIVKKKVPTKVKS